MLEESNNEIFTGLKLASERLFTNFLNIINAEQLWRHCTLKIYTKRSLLIMWHGCILSSDLPRAKDPAPWTHRFSIAWAGGYCMFHIQSMQLRTKLTGYKNRGEAAGTSIFPLQPNGFYFFILLILRSRKHHFKSLFVHANYICILTLVKLSGKKEKHTHTHI